MTGLLDKLDTKACLLRLSAGKTLETSLQLQPLEICQYIINLLSCREAILNTSTVLGNYNSDENYISSCMQASSQTSHRECPAMKPNCKPLPFEILLKTEATDNPSLFDQPFTSRVSFNESQAAGTKF